jgi:zinc finger CCCH domain-containing protein 13
LRSKGRKRDEKRGREAAESASRVLDLQAGSRFSLSDRARYKDRRRPRKREREREREKEREREREIEREREGERWITMQG